MRDRIYYYKLGTTNGPNDDLLYFHEIIIIKKAHTAPSAIWINNILLKGRERYWQKVPGHSFAWWWKWFKDVKKTAVERKELTKTDLFEIIGLQNL